MRASDDPAASPAAYLDGLFSLSGRTALVTGGSSGIGYAMAEAIGRAGAAVVLVARRPAELKDAVERLRGHGVRAASIPADLADAEAVRHVRESAASHFGEIDILANVAANNIRRPMAELTPEDYDLTMRVNITAPYLLGQHFGPRMAARGWGRIINVGSQQSISAFGDSGAYGVSKAAIAGLTRSQAEAWSRHGVSVNTIIPGFVLTPLTAPAQAVPGRVETMAARSMLGRNGLPVDFAGAAVLLAGDAAAYITGQMLFVDGGFFVH
ncbi:gluconate 5-dehydrogenase [Sphaerisporangium krabiense]|uniref:Gluconate 5-dehydrogenase n=1 Tax=Sphaerisporangium krabiense TaxID=763782 RepID=A0A7W8ZBZ0_9ACTN|nr:SDR family oxidoreductase [Sphaerisporangium krabiense]MBB5631214.1 gluconate 5-dehydrogenase [Sphaerisporangium krabiense]GII61173.1 gluconate 5-dehydrogenase [Sphaerisporangium krabiense]